MCQAQHISRPYFTFYYTGLIKGPFSNCKKFTPSSVSGWASSNASAGDDGSPVTVSIHNNTAAHCNKWEMGFHYEIMWVLPTWSTANQQPEAGSASFVGWNRQTVLWIWNGWGVLLGYFIDGEGDLWLWLMSSGDYLKKKTNKKNWPKMKFWPSRQICVSGYGVTAARKHSGGQCEMADVTIRRCRWINN